ncbi:uncharacterized protein F5891DRAFT_276278 [Suillus fuscotomentosus]|uniref:Uncharacterized protein n=1 Tax=Suillus fuscotomentosus TaxID=1912939 RepID=A0AAD4E7C2_9AGAM|nr:uncharacterized protein F5891DRAFT_276278 [Suillus fuscotomentosus]KAG1900981.1 hypothetical protein F5891DRAFT_276278 [Suillus fuscotomentosus]
MLAKPINILPKFRYSIKMAMKLPVCAVCCLQLLGLSFVRIFPMPIRLNIFMEGLSLMSTLRYLTTATFLIPPRIFTSIRTFVSEHGILDRGALFPSNGLMIRGGMDTYCKGNKARPVWRDLSSIDRAVASRYRGLALVPLAVLPVTMATARRYFSMFLMATGYCSMFNLSELVTAVCVFFRFYSSIDLGG